MAEPDDTPRPVLATFAPDRRTYVRGQLTLAVLGSALAAALLAFLEPGQIWVGPVGAVLAVAVRGLYLASEELAQVWELTATGISCRDGRAVVLRDIAKVNRLGATVQLVTRGGDKYLIKHLAEAGAARNRIAAALPGGAG